MKTVMLKLLSSFLLVLAISSQMYAQENKEDVTNVNALSTEKKILVIPVNGMVDNGLVKLVERGIQEAEAGNYTLIIFDMDTYGGLLDAGDNIRSAILDTEIPTIAFVNKNAASAGALIAIATDKIVMAPGSSMGAATVVDGQSGEKSSEKMQSYMRGIMRSTAEAKGRDARYAEAMVDESISIEGVIEEGKLLTFSGSEALEFGYADTLLGSLFDIKVWQNLDEVQEAYLDEKWEESVLRFLSNPVISSILMLMMLGGLYFELQTPGVGFPGSIAAVGAMLFFAPLYITGLAQSWEIVLFFMGVILIALEIFVIPGFGIAGFGGISLVIFSLGAALIGNIGLSFPDATVVSGAIWTMVVTLLLGIGLIYSLSQYLPQNDRFSALVLSETTGQGSGFNLIESSHMLELVGKEAEALTSLRPSGTVKFGNKRIDVVTDGDFIDKGTAVRIVSAVGSRVVVSKIS